MKVTKKQTAIRSGGPAGRPAASSSTPHGSPRSSTSPSLAGTRSKRSLKIPARFHDTEFAFRDVAEALRMKGRSSVDDEKSKATLAMLERRELLNSSKSSTSSSSSSSPASSAATTPATTPAPAPAPAVPAATPQPQQPTPAQNSASATVTRTTPAPAAKSASSLKRENEDTAPIVADGAGDNDGLGVPVKVLKGAFRPSVTYKKQSVSFSAETSAPAAPPASTTTATAITTTTLTTGSGGGGGGAAAAAAARPLVEHVPNTAPAAKMVTTASVTAVSNNRQGSPSKKRSSSSSSSSKKKPVSQAAIKAHNPTQVASAGGGVGISPINNFTIQPAQQNHKPQLQQLLQQPLPQNLQAPARNLQMPQYGARLLPMDQPIYLPISVGNIAPITTTVPLMASMMRKFVSQRVTACLAHQDALKMNSMLSTHEALVKVAQLLGVRDRLALRSASRAWKSIVDSDAVWSRLVVTQEDLTLSWTRVLESFLSRCRTTDVIFKDVNLATCQEVARRLYGLPHLKRVWLKSVDCAQNTMGYKMLASIEQLIADAKKCDKHATMAPFLKHGQVRWSVRVGVDMRGLASVEVLKPALRTYTKQTAGQEDETMVEVELNDLRAEFDWAAKLKLPEGEVARVIISPI